MWFDMEALGLFKWHYTHIISNNVAITTAATFTYFSKYSDLSFVDTIMDKNDQKWLLLL